MPAAEKGFWESYTAPEQVEGQYTSMRDLAKLGEPFVVSEVIDQPENSFSGEVKPRWLLKGRLVDGVEDKLVGVSKGYSRDSTIRAIDKYISDTGEGASVSIKFQKTAGAYIDIVAA